MRGFPARPAEIMPRAGTAGRRRFPARPATKRRSQELPRAQNTRAQDARRCQQAQNTRRKTPGATGRCGHRHELWHAGIATSENYHDEDLRGAEASRRFYVAIWFSICPSDLPFSTCRETSRLKVSHPSQPHLPFPANEKSVFPAERSRPGTQQRSRHPSQGCLPHFAFNQLQCPLAQCICRHFLG